VGQTLSYRDAEYSTNRPAASVPMLDWPSDLFGDNVCLTDLAAVDLLLQFDPAFLPFTQRNPECHAQIAA
jgi:hypothetical protein